jgi:hypothetical protein
MNKQLRLLCGFGLLSLLVMGTAVSSAYADGKCNPKSPLRGTYAFKQVAYAIPSFGPATEAGTLKVDECGYTVGHGVFNGPGYSGFEFDWEAPCVLRASGYEADCTLAGGMKRYCVFSGKGGGGCFDTWRCIISNEEAEPGMVIMAEFERVHAGTCK